MNEVIMMHAYRQVEAPCDIRGELKKAPSMRKNKVKKEGCMSFKDIFDDECEKLEGR